MCLQTKCSFMITFTKITEYKCCLNFLDICSLIVLYIYLNHHVAQIFKKILSLIIHQCKLAIYFIIQSHFTGIYQSPCKSKHTFIHACANTPYQIQRYMWGLEFQLIQTPVLRKVYIIVLYRSLSEPVPVYIDLYFL